MAIDFSKLLKKGGKGIPPPAAAGVGPSPDLGALMGGGGAPPPPTGLPGQSPDMGQLMNAPTAPARKAKPAKKSRGGKRGY